MPEHYECVSAVRHRNYAGACEVMRNIACTGSRFPPAGGLLSFSPLLLPLIIALPPAHICDCLLPFSLRVGIYTEHSASFSRLFAQR